MKGRSGSNRAICIGDKERSGMGSPALSNADILRRMTGWKTPFLKKFITTARNKDWKDAAVWMLAQREGLDRQIKKIENRKKKRHNRRPKANLASTECCP